MLAIVVSRADSASEHVGEHLLDLADWEERVDDSRTDADGGATVSHLDDAELRFFDELHLETTRVADAFDDPDLLVFASRHAGETDELLTAHHTGNFGEAEFGGTDGGLARACPNAHRRVVEALGNHAPEGYEVGMECTHHGPSDVGAPSMFVEVGSDEAQWSDPEAARAVASAILDLREVEPDTPRENGARRQLVGFGGGHYAPRFDRVVRETDWAVGHVAADWCLDAMGDPEANESVVRQAFEASAADYALLEADRPALRETIADLGYRVVSETWVRETTGVPLGLVERAENAIATIDEGLRFGDAARDADDAADPVDFDVVSISADLLTEACGIDAERVLNAVSERAVAFGTEQNGTRVVGPVAVRNASDRDQILDGIADVLRTKYDEVTRSDDDLIARRQALDPERAQMIGVPEGPKFGRLSSGEAVEVDGRTIKPEDVSRERKRRFNC
jgi:D-aminoacyl-tRNA deacylase